jgi:extracellular factor (EF) 3-hydroxypalmitic acid methyl ester biosynthesis protein
MDIARQSPTGEWQGRARARLLSVFDQVASCIESDQIETGITLLAGAALTVDDVREAHGLLRSHRLHSILLEDPYTAQAFNKPRGYAGDALVMDMIYDQTVPDGTSARGRDLFAVTTSFPVAQAVRGRRELAANLVQDASGRGERICSLACGHLREVDDLPDRNFANITAVDQDALSVDYVRGRHPVSLDVRQINVFGFLRGALAKGDKYDLIYTLGFTDYCDRGAMSLLYRLMTRCLADTGTILVANFTPGHLAQGWLEVCLDWHLIYRDESVMRRHAEENGLDCELWRDATGSVLYSKLKRVN